MAKATPTSTPRFFGKKKLLLTAIGTAAAITAMPSYAQDTNKLEEVVVSAT